MEPGETLAEAIVREIREELGCTIGVDGFLRSVEYAYPDVTVRLSLLSCHVEEGRPQKLEHQEIRWVTEEEAKAFALCPADRILLESAEE